MGQNVYSTPKTGRIEHTADEANFDLVADLKHAQGRELAVLLSSHTKHSIYLACQVVVSDDDNTVERVLDIGVQTKNNELIRWAANRIKILMWPTPELKQKAAKAARATHGKK